MKPVSRAVSRLLRGLGLSEDVARAKAVDAWPSAARAVFGPDAGETRAIAVDGETIVVSVPTSAWSSEIRLRSRELLRLIDEAAPGSGIRRVRCVAAPRARPPG